MLAAMMPRLRAPLAATVAVAIAVALTAAAPASAQNMVEVHWETLANGKTYTDAGDYASDFSPSLDADGIWELEPTTNGTPVLGYIGLANTGSGTVEVHGDALNGSAYTRVWNFASDYSPALAADGVFQLFGASNGAPELGFIDLRNTGSGTIEVHWETMQNGVYVDAGDYASDFPESLADDGDWELLATSTGTPVLGLIELKDTGSGTVEVHEDALNGNQYTRIDNYASHYPLSDAGDGVWQLFGASNGTTELGFIDLTNTGSGTVEVHWETMQNNVFTDAGDYASGYPESDAAQGTWQLFTPGSDASPELGFVKDYPPAPPPAPTPTPAPIVTTQTLPVPKSSRAKHGRIRARFTLQWTWNHARTRLHGMRVTGVPRDGRVEVSCSGKGCPQTATIASYKHLHRLVRSLDGRVFRAGDVLTITVSAPNKRSERIAVRIRDGALPTARLL
jgi:hypothetical protein